MSGAGAKPMHAGDQAASLRAAMRTASRLSSTSTNPRPCRAAASPVVPLPAKKSSTTSPGREWTFTIRSRIPSGFCVG